MKETIIKILKEKASLVKSSNPYFELELLLAFVLKKSRVFILSHPRFELSNKQINLLNKLIKRRLNEEPLAYIVGEKEFYGLKFFVNKNVLVPRPETELIVEEILNNQKHRVQNTTYIDIGTGSGCIIIAIAKLLKSKENEFIGVDISKKALTVARKNAKLHKVNKKIKFLHGNLLSTILKSTIVNRQSQIVILANLPYLTSTQVKNSPTIQKEPKLALVAGKDGLKYYRKLFKQICRIQDTTNRIQIICEIDSSQGKSIKELIKKILPKAKMKIKKDFSGRNRFAVIKL